MLTVLQLKAPSAHVVTNSTTICRIHSRSFTLPRSLLHQWASHSCVPRLILELSHPRINPNSLHPTRHVYPDRRPPRRPERPDLRDLCRDDGAERHLRLPAPSISTTLQGRVLGMCSYAPIPPTPALKRARLTKALYPVGRCSDRPLAGTSSLSGPPCGRIVC